MKPYFVKTPFFLKKIYPKRLWDIQTGEQNMYLTFDDGPTAEVTPWILETLKKYNAKATFFCIGKNVKKEPELFRQILKDGHEIGNHTNNHLNGWQTSLGKYIANTEKAEKRILKVLPEGQKNLHRNKKLFRPPYGRMTSAQAKNLMKLGYEIVMWDVLSADYDQKISPEQCSRNVLKSARAGSIIIFHDSLKAEKNMKVALIETLEFFKNKKFSFKSI